MKKLLGIVVLGWLWCGATYAVSYTHSGLHGYMSAEAKGNGLKYSYGLSYYTSIWAIFENHLIDQFQIGHGTWITPNNHGNKPLCPKGTMARDNWPERGPSYRDVFQTIEGGPGYWWNTKFPSPQMKYRVNGTTDCYTSQIASPGWTWDGSALGSNVPGIAQLSNRLLYPPDGITFKLGDDPKILGNAWMALPLTPKTITNNGHVTGQNNWTLFLNAENFSGPVVYWVPEAWSKISKNYSPANGHTLDSKLKMAQYPQSMANEINTVYMYQQKKNGKTYSRIPKLKFPVDDKGRTIFHQDVKMYSKDAIYNDLEKAINNSGKYYFPDGQFKKDGTYISKLKAYPTSLKQDNKKIKRLNEILKFKSFNYPGNKNFAWGIQWQKNYLNGYFPEYFIDRKVALTQEIPRDIFLKLDKKKFPKKKHKSRGYYDSRLKNHKGQTFKAYLNDNSVVTYRWYKFIDQPAIKKLNLSQTAKDRLQGIVETIHMLWTIDKEFIESPTTGKLAIIENSLIVFPPEGMQTGYVPIAIKQVWNK